MCVMSDQNLFGPQWTPYRFQRTCYHGTALTLMFLPRSPRDKCQMWSTERMHFATSNRHHLSPKCVCVVKYKKAKSQLTDVIAFYTSLHIQHIISNPSIFLETFICDKSDSKIMRKIYIYIHTHSSSCSYTQFAWC